MLHTSCGQLEQASPPVCYTRSDRHYVDSRKNSASDPQAHHITAHHSIAHDDLCGSSASSIASSRRAQRCRATCRRQFEAGKHQSGQKRAVVKQTWLYAPRLRHIVMPTGSHWRPTCRTWSERSQGPHMHLRALLPPR